MSGNCWPSVPNLATLADSPPGRYFSSPSQGVAGQRRSPAEGLRRAIRPTQACLSGPLELFANHGGHTARRVVHQQLVDTWTPKRVEGRKWETTGKKKKGEPRPLILRDELATLLDLILSPIMRTTGGRRAGPWSGPGGNAVNGSRAEMATRSAALCAHARPQVCVCVCLQCVSGNFWPSVRGGMLFFYKPSMADPGVNADWRPSLRCVFVFRCVVAFPMPNPREHSCCKRQLRMSSSTFCQALLECRLVAQDLLDDQVTLLDLCVSCASCNRVVTHLTVTWHPKVCSIQRPRPPRLSRVQMLRVSATMAR